MLVRFWGVRGSCPAPGAHTVKYGGNTPCISVELSPSETLIIDAGTGLRELGDEKYAGKTESESHTYFILLSHLHWDHIHGIPLFAGFMDARARIEFISDKKSSWGRKVMDLFGGDHFPLSVDDLRATVVHREDSPAAVLAPYFDNVKRIRLNHPGLCYGYRLTKGDKSIVYMTDNEVMSMPEPVTSRDALVSFCRNTDYLIHDAQFTAVDLPEKCGWGHSETSEVCRLAADANVGTLVLFHHDPNRSDDDIDRLVEDARDCISDVFSAIEFVVDSSSPNEDPVISKNLRYRRTSASNTATDPLVIYATVMSLSVETSVSSIPPIDITSSSGCGLNRMIFLPDIIVSLYAIFLRNPSKTARHISSISG